MDKKVSLIRSVNFKWQPGRLAIVVEKHNDPLHFGANCHLEIFFIPEEVFEHATNAFPRLGFLQRPFANTIDSVVFLAGADPSGFDILDLS